MTPSERKRLIHELAKKNGWNVPASVVELLSYHPEADAAERIEVVLTIGNDLASLRGQPLSTTIIEDLLRPPETPTKAYPKNPSKIISAIEDGQPSELRRALRRRDADLEEISDYHDGMTPLLLALFQRDLKMTVALVEAGADVNHRGRFRDAPIHLAMKGRGTKRLETLLRAGADPDSRDAAGRTPLMIAAADDLQLDKVRVLLDAGADRDLVDDRGDTALHIARREGAARVAALLDSDSSD